jgi:hypothetical protein
MKWLSAGISFIIVFVIVFILGGWFLMPHLPPIPESPISVYELDYPTVNLPGALLGLILAGLSARSIIKKNTKTNLSFCNCLLYH